MIIYCTRLFTAISFAVFLYSIYMSAQSFLSGQYINQLLFILSGVFSYMSYREFVNNSNEEIYY